MGYHSFLPINGISFTQRELDILSLVIQGKSTKKIAGILSISPNTVETHLRNVKVKTQLNSREALAEFLEKNSQYENFRKLATKLQVGFYFEETLKKIGNFLQDKKIKKLNFHTVEKLTPFDEKMAQRIKNDFKKLGEREASNVPEEITVHIHSAPPEAVSNIQGKFDFILIFNKSENHASSHNLINFDCENYYTSLLTLIGKVYPDKEVESLQHTFATQSKNLENYPKSALKTDSLPPQQKFFKTRQFFMPALLVVLSSLIYYFSQKTSNPYGPVTAKMALHIPSKPLLLHRKEVLQKIEEKLTNKNDISIVTLVGTEGAGKTFLARRYARKRNANITWVIQADTPKNILFSFEKLAHALCQSEEDKKELNFIGNIEKSELQKDALVRFVSQRLKKSNDWLLIYEKPSSLFALEGFFPHDKNIWGTGSILVITQNQRIQDDIYLDPENIIQVGELNAQEKLSLIKKIVGRPSFKQLDKQKLQRLLKKIPPFPLDVALASYYLKDLDMDLDAFMRQIQGKLKNFSSDQGGIIKHTSGYKKTRYKIIELSIDTLIAKNGDYKDLILLMFVLDSDSISTRLLSHLKGERITLKFIRDLSEHSLIHIQEKKLPPHKDRFKIHRTTQAIGLEVLSSRWGEDELNKRLSLLTRYLGNYADRQLAEMKTVPLKEMAAHLESFLLSIHNRSELISAKIQKKLGAIYRYLGDFKAAKAHLEEALYAYKKNFGKESLKSCKVEVLLASLYRALGLYHEGQNLIQHALPILIKNVGMSHSWVGDAFLELGSIERSMRNYKKALADIQKGLKITLKAHGKDNLKTAKALGYLGFVQYVSGRADLAIDSLKESLEISQKHLNKKDILNLANMTHLGVAFSLAGQHKKAIDILEKSLQKHLALYPKNHARIGSVFRKLGVAYQNKRQFKQAENFLKKSLAIYQISYGPNHVKTLRISAQLDLLHTQMKNDPTDKKG